MGTLTARAQAIAAECNAVDGLRALVDPADVATNLPCLLIAPPILEGRRADDSGWAKVTWRFILLASGPATLSAVDELDTMLDLLVTQAGADVERAEPGTYQVAGNQAVACYVATYTE
jgi:hypothetical protein